MAETNIVTWVANGTEYAVDLFALSALDWRDARRATGRSQAELARAALIDKDIESIGTFIWLVRRRADPTETFESVLESLTIGTLIQEDDDAEQVDA